MTAQIALSKPQYGAPLTLEPGVRMLLANNPSPMTYWGTNTFILGTRELVVIDPGPADPVHLQAILDAAGDVPIRKIVITHAHLDHSPLAAELSAKTGAPIIAFGTATAGRSALMSRLLESGPLGGGEGLDMAFEPDEIVQDGDTIAFDGAELQVIHTPGHLGCHIALAWGDMCFTGDHVMQWASSLVSPPDGDLTDFMNTSDRLLQTDWRILYPSHGAPITNPAERLNWLVNHRKSREAEILQQLQQGPATAQGLAQAIYTDVDPKLMGAAMRNVLAHLVDLYGRELIQPRQQFDSKAVFELSGKNE